MIINKIKDNWEISIVIFIAIALRFIPINQYQFSYDELSSLNRTIFPSLSQTLSYGVKIDAHPALVQVFLWIWVNLFGYNEIALKLPYLLCGVFSVWQIYIIAQKHFSKQAGFLSATVLATSFIFLIYSSYIRMYITGVFFSVLLIKYAFAIMFNEQVSKKQYGYFVLSALLCAYNHHISSLFAFTVGVLMLGFINKQKILPFLISCVVIIVLYLPHLPITFYQFSKAGIGANAGGWLPPPRINELYYFILALFGTGIIAKIVVIILCALVVYFFAVKNKITKAQLFLALIFIINYSIIHLYSVYRSPILQYSVLLFCGVSLVLLLCSFASALTIKQSYVICLTVLCLLTYQSVGNKHFLSTASKHTFDTQAIQYFKLKNEGKNVFGVFSGDAFYPYLYQKKYNTKMHYVLNSDSVFATKALTKMFYKSLKANYLVLSDATPQQVENAKEFFPFIQSHEQGNFVNVIVLFKNENSAIERNAFEINTYDAFSLKENIKLETQLQNNQHQYTIDSLAGEFPFAIKTKFNNFNANEGQWLLVEINFETDSIKPTTEDLLAISINTANETKNHYTAVKFSDFNIEKGPNKLYLEMFVGSNYQEWINSGEFVCFVWKKDKSTLKINNFTIKQLDYNPDRWTLWK